MENLRHGDLLITETQLPKEVINTGIVKSIVLAHGEYM
jgi:hypothetical protein